MVKAGEDVDLSMDAHQLALPRKELLLIGLNSNIVVGLLVRLLLDHGKLSFTDDNTIVEFLIDVKDRVLTLLFPLFDDLLERDPSRLLEINFLFLLIWLLFHRALGSPINLFHECLFLGLFLLLFLNGLFLNLLDLLQVLGHEIFLGRQRLRFGLVLFLRLCKLLLSGNRRQLLSNQLHLYRLLDRFLDYAVFASFDLLLGRTSGDFLWGFLLFLRM